MIIFGTRASNIGSIEVPSSSCDYCKQEGKQQVSVFGRYFHVFWIPVFPFGKSVFSECTHCKKTIRKKEFSPQLKTLYLQKSDETKRPIWHWAGSLIFVALVFFFVFARNSARDSAENTAFNTKAAVELNEVKKI